LEFFNNLIKTELPLTFDENVLVYRDNIVFDYGIKLNGMKYGLFYLYDDQFFIIDALLYSNDLVTDGKHIEYMSRLKGEVQYLNGKRNGKCIYWSEDGRKKREEGYIDDKLYKIFFLA